MDIGRMVERFENSEKLELLLEESRNVSTLRTRDSTKTQISIRDFLSTCLVIETVVATQH